MYALGTVLLYAAAAHYPYDGTRWEAIAAQVTNSDIAPDLSGVPPVLVPLLESMLAHEPEDRPTLTAVSDACAEILADSGTSPASARLALIARTASGEPPSEAGEPFTASFEKLLQEQAARAVDGEPESPLDVPPRAAAPGEQGHDEAEPDAEAFAAPLPEPTTASERQRPRPKAGSPKGRPPASKRVADELRTQYAVDLAL